MAMLLPDTDDLKKTLSVYNKKYSDRVIYTQIHDCINNMKFDTITPVFYQPMMPSIFTSGELEPFYDEPDMNAMAYSKSTIYEMIDMRSKGIRFELRDIEDNILIRKLLKMYLDSIRTYYSDSPNGKAFLEKSATFERELDRNYDKLMNTKLKYRVDKNISAPKGTLETLAEIHSPKQGRLVHYEQAVDNYK